MNYTTAYNTNLVTNPESTWFKELIKSVHLDQVEEGLWEDTLSWRYVKKELHKRMAEKFMQENKSSLVKINKTYQQTHASHC